MFFRMLGIFLLLPVIAVLASDKENSTPLVIGMALGGYGLTQALLQIPVGIIADRYGRKPVLLVALALFTIGGFVAAAADDIGGIIAGRLLQGTGAVAGVIAAWIADVSLPQYRTRCMAVFGAAIGAAFIVSLFAAPPLASSIHLSGVFTVAGGLGIAAILLVLPLAPPPKPSPPLPTLNLIGLLKNDTLRLCASGAFALHYAMSAVFFLLPRALINDLPVADHWRVYAGSFFLSLVLCLPLIWRADSTPRRVSVLAGISVITGVALLSLADSVTGACMAMFFFFGGFVCLEAMLPGLATKTAPHQQRATAVGVVMTAEFSGIFLGGVITGFMESKMNSTISIWVVCLLLTIWLCLVITSKTNPPTEHK